MPEDLLDPVAGDDRRRPILLGEAPSRVGDRFHMFPLSGRPAQVLCGLAGIPPQDGGTRYGRWTWALYEHFDCRNLIDRYADAEPWSVPVARDRARALLDELRAEQVECRYVPPGTGHPQEEIYRQLSGATRVQRITVAPPPVIVCLGRRVQRAIGDALDFPAMRLHANLDTWGGEMFGTFGVWAAPWQIRPPIVRASDPARPFYLDVTERPWAPWVVTIPHPSGLNRLLNDEVTRARCGEVLRHALKLAADAGTVAT